MNIALYENQKTGTLPEVTAFFTETWYPLPAVIVLPGGGYSQHAAHEAEPIAEFYQNSGFHAFLLKYRLLPALYPAALEDVQRLIKYLRSHARELKVDPDRIFVIGFSAGGHLAALSGVAEDVCPAVAGAHRPSGVLLGYPVITSAQGCVKKVCGNEEALYEKLSAERQVTRDTPQMFIWHTSDDAVVDVRHSLSLAAALKEQGVPCEMHIFPHGEHGLGLAKLRPDVRSWAQMSVDWMIRNF